MKKYKYTNKEERPIPKYKNGDIAWYIDGCPTTLYSKGMLQRILV